LVIFERIELVTFERIETIELITFERTDADDQRCITTLEPARRARAFDGDHARDLQPIQTLRKCRSAGPYFDENPPQRESIACAAESAIVALGGETTGIDRGTIHVRIGAAQRRSAERSAVPEVRDPHGPVPVQQNILGVEVAVDGSA
jgi:hypothetical protein